MYLAFNFLCAFTPTFAGLLVGRFLSSFFASAALSNSPGALGDVWNANGRGRAMILFSVATFLGPALGPVASGFLELKENWRWTFYMLLWLAGITEVLLIGLPETLDSTILIRMAQQLRTHSKNGSKIQARAEAADRSLLTIYKRSLKRPWIILFDPISFLIAIYYSVVYTLLYMLFSIYPIVFQQKRGWNPGVGELPLLGVVVGALLGGLLLFGLDIHLKRSQENIRTTTPEGRLPAAMLGGVLFAITMFWFAWTAEFNSIHWAVPTVAGMFLSTSILLIFVSFINYLLDSYLAFAASAVAANTVVRSACAAAEPLFTQYMFDALGVSGGGSLIGGVAVLLAPIPFVFYRYGKSIRERSNFAAS